MKSLAITLFFLAAIVLAYDGLLAPPKDRWIFPKPQETCTAAKANPEAAAPVVPVPAQAKVSQFRAPAATPQAPPPVATTPKVIEAKLPEAKPTFQAPSFDPIEKLTSNWTQLPKTAFPRTVVLVKDTTIKVNFGSSRMHSGSEVTALSLDNGLVLIKPTATSTLKGTVPVDNTDLKTRLSADYDKWKLARNETARHAFEVRQRQPQSQPASLVSSPTPSATDPPQRSTDGTYPLLLAQMRSGNPSEITPTNVIRWGSPAQETLKGLALWTIPVTYKTKTMFGEMEVDTVAHVQKGRVIDWVYRGSGEPVP